jgi:hypothetical protein
VRYLAPIALAAVIGGTYLVVHTGLTKKDSVAQRSRGPRAGRAHRRLARAKFYAVKPGDSLTSIARNIRIAISTLESLNPTLDPNSLQTGQRLRLRR